MHSQFTPTLIRREVVESTSDLARQLLDEGAIAPPFVVRAASQTRGRGRGAHAWWSVAGSLTFTIAIDPAAHRLRTGHAPRLALATAVAAIEAMRAITPGAGAALGIRWPNDIEVGGRKVGGILPEWVGPEDAPRILIGIGLNVRTDLAASPSGVRAMASTIEEVRGRPVTSDEFEALFAAILDRFGAVLPDLADDDPALAGCWDALDTLRGQHVRVAIGPEVVEGRGRGIDSRGGLILEVEDRRMTLFGGQILRDR